MANYVEYSKMFKDFNEAYDEVVNCMPVIKQYLAEKASDDYPYYIPENKEFKIQDGMEFDLSKPEDLSVWEAIKNAPIIATSRYEKDANGDYVIDGNVYFGEITFYPASGLGLFTPAEWNLKLGEMIKLPSKV